MDQIYWTANWLGYVVMAVTILITIIGLLKIMTTPLTSNETSPVYSKDELALTSKIGSSRKGIDRHFDGLDLNQQDLCEKGGNTWIVAGGPFDNHQSHCQCRSHFTGSSCDIQLYDERYTAVAQGTVDNLSGAVIGRVTTPYISFQSEACTTQCDKTVGCEAVFYDGRNCVLYDDRGITGAVTYDPDKMATIFTRGKPILKDGVSYITDSDNHRRYIRPWIRDKHASGGYLRLNHVHRLDKWPESIDNQAGHLLVIADDYFEGDQWKTQPRKLTFKRELPVQPPGWTPPYYLALVETAF